MKAIAPPWRESAKLDSKVQLIILTLFMLPLNLIAPPWSPLIQPLLIVTLVKLNEVTVSAMLNTRANDPALITWPLPLISILRVILIPFVNTESKVESKK